MNRPSKRTKKTSLCWEVFVLEKEMISNPKISQQNFGRPKTTK
jgi:hypothetical protein